MQQNTILRILILYYLYSGLYARNPMAVNPVFEHTRQTLVGLSLPAVGGIEAGKCLTVSSVSQTLFRGAFGPPIGGFPPIFRKLGKKLAGEEKELATWPPKYWRKG